MSIYQEWKDNGSDYDQGVTLYCSHEKCNPNLLRNFRRSKTRAQQIKLRYELKKLYGSKLDPIVKPKPKESKPSIALSKKDTSQINPLYLENLPEPIRKKRVEAYKLWIDNCDLKAQLNTIPKNSERESLEIQFKIWANLEEQKNLWDHIHYYEKYKNTLPEVKNEFVSMSPTKLLRTQQLKHQSISKSKKAIKQYEDQIENTSDLKEKNRMVRALERNRKKVIQLKSDLIKINQIINNH